MLFHTFNSLVHQSAPIAYPIAKILDYVLGAGRHQTYKKAELKSFLQFHRTGEEPLRDEELVILNGVLELNTKEVERIMTPLRVWFYRLVLVLLTDLILFRTLWFLVRMIYLMKLLLMPCQY